MKTYVLTVSRKFPATHKRKGEQTYFRERIHESFWPVTETPILGKKLHTIRANYPLWEKRIKEVQKGNAILSLRYWSGKPYNSKQVEFARLDKDSGCGIQKIELNFKTLVSKVDGSAWSQNIDVVGKNDGLSFEDFKEWFRKYDLSKPMAIIHFTKFRY